MLTMGGAKDDTGRGRVLSKGHAEGVEVGGGM